MESHISRLNTHTSNFKSLGLEFNINVSEIPIVKKQASNLYSEKGIYIFLNKASSRVMKHLRTTLWRAVPDRASGGGW